MTTALCFHNYNIINSTLFELFTLDLTSTDDALCLAQEVLVRGHTEITCSLKQSRKRW